ncbi:MAG: hypothetical protein U5R06_07490 [candidate division KSB1 bacterium]|nr:hypothetical protein [candidate division KSB1 bacterium]
MIESYEDSTFTLMIRVKGENNPETYDRSIDIQWRNGNAGTRDELRIFPADSVLELEKAETEIKLPVDFYEWHTFRIVVNGDVATVYLDEAQEPVLSGTSGFIDRRQVHQIRQRLRRCHRRLCRLVHSGHLRGQCAG